MQGFKTTEFPRISAETVYCKHRGSCGWEFRVQEGKSLNLIMYSVPEWTWLRKVALRDGAHRVAPSTPSTCCLQPAPKVRLLPAGKRAGTRLPPCGRPAVLPPSASTSVGSVRRSRVASGLISRTHAALEQHESMFLRSLQRIIASLMIRSSSIPVGKWNCYTRAQAVFMYVN